MPREPEPSLNERLFLLEALQSDIRLDGRAHDAYRDLSISFGEEYGVADVRIGKTRVLARISATITSPHPDRKFDGIFTISTELSPLASPAFEAGRPSELEINLNQTLDHLFRRSSALPTESLCLIAGKSAWSLSCTIHILNHAGNLLDTCSIAALAALRHYRIPATEVRGGELKVFTVREREPEKLALLHWPLCVTISFFAAGEGEGGADGGKKWVIDAGVLEEGCREGVVVVGANREGEIVLMRKERGGEVDAREMLGWVGIAVQKAKGLVGRVEEALERDRETRDGGMEKELRAENER